ILKGEEATIIDFALIKFRMGDWILPCATLRPETVFGVTNLWVNPDVVYVIAKVNEETWIVSREAYEKLTYTDRQVSLEGRVDGRQLIGKMATNPVTGNEIIVLPAGFVDPDNGSGMVMSVPAHAPFDYLALRDLYGKGAWDRDTVKYYLLGMHTARPFMPPFPGTEREAGALADYLLDLRAVRRPVIGAQDEGVVIPDAAARVAEGGV
ncbi:MAG: class I tRNA ligase family protein, partial [Thermoanaerobaculales bacterium]|nr:class I tRNA ligase family protein [Thermoanaerobaculales bacterium]